MPLRFRSVVPYTLPGILGLIGWWWYISRKKRHLIICEPKDGTPATLGLNASPAEGSNCVVEKDTVSPKNGTAIPSQRLSQVSNQSFENEIIFDIQVHNTEAASSLEQCSEEATPDFGRQRDVVDKFSVLPADDDDVQEFLSEHRDLNKSLPLAFVTDLEKHMVKDPCSAVIEDILPCRSTEITWSTSTKTCVSDAERPEPEGEVAKNDSLMNAQDTVVVSAVTSPKMQSVIPTVADYFETSSVVQDSHQHILTSTPAAFAQTTTGITIVQNTITASMTPEDFHVHSSSGEHQDLELLAAGLVTEVISSATQEILGVTSCEVTYGSRPSCITTTPLCHSRLCFLQEPITGAQKHPNLLSNPSTKGHESRESPPKEIYNGSSSAPSWELVEVSEKVHQNVVQRGLWPTVSHQSAQTTPLLNTQLKADDVLLLACDGSANIQSMLENPTDVIPATEVGQSQSLLEARDEATILPVMAEEVVRFNAMELRNGPHETCEVEADHSGGER